MKLEWSRENLPEIDPNMVRAYSLSIGDMFSIIIKDKKSDLIYAKDRLFYEVERDNNSIAIVDGIVYSGLRKIKEWTPEEINDSI